MGAHGWVAGICQPWGQFFYLGAGWLQWKPLGIPGTHFPLKRGCWLTAFILANSLSVFESGSDWQTIRHRVDRDHRPTVPYDWVATL